MPYQRSGNVRARSQHYLRVQRQPQVERGLAPRPYRLSDGAAHNAAGSIRSDQQIVSEALHRSVWPDDAHAPRCQVDALSVVCDSASGTLCAAMLATMWMNLMKPDAGAASLGSIG